MKDKSQSIDISAIYRELEVPDNIIRHMRKVAAICLFLADKMDNIDNHSLTTAALCHDIMKLHGPNHEDRAGDYFSQKGLTTIADIIRKHRYTSLVDSKEANRPITPEEKIVYYADKRVLHDQIVTVDHRLKDGRERYPVEHGDTVKDQQVEKHLKKMESELSSQAKISPADITEEAIAPYYETLPV